MSYCVVFGCKNRSVKKNYEQLEYKAKNKKISFHLFPQNMENREKWLVALHLKGIQIHKTAAVCSAHFQEEDYEPGHSLRKLKKYAVPYLHQEESIPVVKPVTVEPAAVEPVAVEPAALGFVKEHVFSTGTSKSMEIEDSITQKTMVDKFTSISPKRLFNSPTKIQLREIHAREMKLLKRKLSVSNNKKKNCKINFIH
ncbi:uncharacterized protein [Linepithema humile]|uniref:uncharacterized protein n=1 Tax=Linepithema humile TaxID=83485 RepID=UPI00351EB759